jgi:aminopeptidase
MSEQQRNLSPAIDPIKLDRLAEVAVKVGLRLREGQDLLLTASAVALPLVRKIAEHAYKAGAGLVTPILGDEELTLARYRYGHGEGFDRAAGWLYQGMAKAFSENTARLAIVGDNPMLLAGEDPTTHKRWRNWRMQSSLPRAWTVKIRFPPGSSTMLRCAAVPNG